jgi:hypothetical protein
MNEPGPKSVAVASMAAAGGVAGVAVGPNAGADPGPYQIPATMARWVRQRDVTCRFPGCRQPARRCDIDHARAWPAGPTQPANLLCLCRRHHRLKQTRRWHVQLQPNGTAVWVGPTGQIRLTRAPLHSQRGQGIAKRPTR